MKAKMSTYISNKEQKDIASIDDLHLTVLGTLSTCLWRLGNLGAKNNLLNSNSPDWHVNLAGTMKRTTTQAIKNAHLPGHMNSVSLKIFAPRKFLSRRAPHRYIILKKMSAISAHNRTCIKIFEDKHIALDL